jgi:iron-sulfur cluster assembly protein
MSEYNQIVTLTPQAANKVREFQIQLAKQCLRLSIKFEGPTGFMYDLDMDSVASPRDATSTTQGIQVLVDREYVPLVKGCVIDWQKTPDGREGFYFDNPNAVDQ